MNYAWMCPIVLEKALGARSGPGRHVLRRRRLHDLRRQAGRRVVNEKLPYNELAQAFFRWDAARGEYPNLVLVQVWDQRSQDHSASDEYGRLIVAAGRRRRPRHPRRDAGGAGRRGRARGFERSRRTGGVPLSAGLPGQPAGDHRALQRLRRRRARRGLRPRRARRPAALQRRRQGRAGPHEPDHVADRAGGAVLRRAGHRRHARHQGRSEDQRPTARSSTTSASPIPGSTASATASPRRRPAPTGRAAPRSARSSPSPTARPAPRTPSPSRSRTAATAASKSQSRRAKRSERCDPQSHARAPERPPAERSGGQVGATPGPFVR